MFRRKQADIHRGGTLLSPKEYIAALSNQNTRTLLNLLGSEPPLPVVLDPPSDIESTYVKNRIIKTIKNTGRWVGNMAGLGQLSSQLVNVSKQYQQQFMNQVEFALEGAFLPLKAFAREMVWQYESQIAPYPTGAGMGGLLGGVGGSAMGFYIGGPGGAAILGGAMEVYGSVMGANAERSWDKWMRPLSSGDAPWWWWIVAPFVWLWETFTGESVGGPLTSNPASIGNAGIPYNRTRMGQAPTRSRTAGLVNKMKELDRLRDIY